MLFFFKNMIFVIFFLQVAVFCLTKPLVNDQQLRERKEEPFYNLQQKQQLELDKMLMKTPTIMNYDSSIGDKAKQDDCDWSYTESGYTLTAEDEEIMTFFCTDNNSYLCWLWRNKNNNNNNNPNHPWLNRQNDKKLRNRKEYWQEEINFRLIVPLASQKGQLKKQQILKNNLVIKAPKIDYDILLDNVEGQGTYDEYKRLSKFGDNYDADILSNYENSMPMARDKRLQLILENTSDAFRPPHYPHATTSHYGYRNTKRVKSQVPVFYPSISAEALSDLGKFFEQLTQNVHFAENRRFGPNEQKLLEGDHPLNALNQHLNADDKQMKIKTEEFLDAIRSYRPSQKIRSLVAMNPDGYRGTQFLDPNYMWVGLGRK